MFPRYIKKVGITMELMDRILYSALVQITWLFMYRRLFPKRRIKQLGVEVTHLGIMTVAQIVFYYTLRPIWLIAILLFLYASSCLKFKTINKKVLLVETVLTYEIALAAMVISSFPAYTICTLILHTTENFYLTAISGIFLVPTYVLLCKVLKKREVERIGDNLSEGVLATIMLMAFSALGIIKLPPFKFDQQLKLRLYAVFTLMVGVVLVLQWVLHLRKLAENKRRDAEEKEQLARAAKEKEKQLLGAEGDNHKLTKAIADTQERVEYLQKQLEIMHDPAFTQAMSAELQTCLSTISEIEQGMSEDVDRALYSDLEVQSGNAGVDEYLRLTARKMAANKIKFLCAVQEDAASFLVPSALSAYDLRQIIANLVENAAHSVEESGIEERVVTFSFGKTRGAVRLRISDSGAYFDPLILQNLGAKGNTIGGNGFGLVNILEALARCNASFLIEEFYPPKAIGYKKSITLLFDGAGMVSVASPHDGTESYRLSIENVLNRTTKIEESLYVPDR